MKRFLTVLMAAILVAMTAVNINVPEAAAAPTATECQELLSFHPFLKDDPYFMEACSSSETENTIKTQCQEDISYDPSLKEEPYFLEECGLYINTAVQIVDIELVNYCTDELEHYPETKEDPYFKKECSDALKSADACREYLFNGSKSILEQLDPKVAPYQFDNYCYVLDNFGILKPDLSSNVEPKSSVASTPTKSVSSAPLNFTREQGETCPAGKTLATVSEARANKSEICNNVLQTWDIARLAGGAAMDGRGYGCEIRDQDKRGMGNAVCK
ncbi:MAG: hypothetical protein F6J96_24235 [Symploca sp. SIO1C2]|nr:hypothetical protein [Symploca sp. SIO1C2]